MNTLPRAMETVAGKFEDYYREHRNPTLVSMVVKHQSCEIEDLEVPSQGQYLTFQQWDVR